MLVVLTVLSASRAAIATSGERYRILRLDATGLSPNQSLQVLPSASIDLTKNNDLYHFEAPGSAGVNMVWLPPELFGEEKWQTILSFPDGLLRASLKNNMAQGADPRIIAASFAFVFIPVNKGADFIVNHRKDGGIEIYSFNGEFSYGLLSKPQERKTLASGMRVILFPEGDKNNPSKEVTDRPAIMFVMAQQDTDVHADEDDEDDFGISTGTNAAMDDEETIEVQISVVYVNADSSAASDSSSSQDFGVSAGASESSPGDDAAEDNESIVVDTIVVFMDYDPTQYQANEDESNSESESLPGPVISSLSFGPVDAMVYGLGQDFELLPGDLDRGRTLVISGELENVQGVSSVEYSLDGGLTWRLVSGIEAWEFAFDPHMGITHNIKLRTIPFEGESQVFNLGTVLIYGQSVPVEAAPENMSPPVFTFLSLCGQEVNPDIPLQEQVPIITRDDLVYGQIEVRGGIDDADMTVVRIEVSADGGRTWGDAHGTTDNWEYSFDPLKQETIELVIRLTTEDGIQFLAGSAGELTFDYEHTNRADSLIDKVDELMGAYINRDIITLMNDIATEFKADTADVATRAEFEDCLRDDFSQSSNAFNLDDLNYKITSVSVDDYSLTAEIRIEWSNSLTNHLPANAVLNFLWDQNQWQLREVAGQSPFCTIETLAGVSDVQLIVGNMNIINTGQSQAEVSATVVNESGLPLPGRTVAFNLDPATAGTLSANQAVTDQRGIAVVLLRPAFTQSDTVYASITVVCENVSAKTDFQIHSDAPPLPDAP